MNNGKKLPSPQLVFSPDFWTINSIIALKGCGENLSIPQLWLPPFCFWAPNIPRAGSSSEGNPAKHHENNAFHPHFQAMFFPEGFPNGRKLDIRPPEIFCQDLMWKLVNCVALGQPVKVDAFLTLGYALGNIAAAGKGGSPEGVDDFYLVKRGDIPTSYVSLPRRVKPSKIPNNLKTQKLCLGRFLEFPMLLSRCRE